MTVMTRQAEPRGQILVVVAAGLVVLMAIAALVVDLGFSWMLRRQEQNAADPAAIAAARWLKDDLGNPQSPYPMALSEACFYARENGFFPDATTNDMTLTGCVSRNDPRNTTLEVHSPPISGDYSGQTGKVQVIITSTHPSFFARVFRQSDATVSTEAIAANENGNSNSASLVALKSDCSAGSAATVTGGGSVEIFPVDPGAIGGYVHVNSTCGGSTDDSCIGSGQKALDINGGSDLVTPQANTVGSCVLSGGGALYCDQTKTTTDCVDEAAIPLGDPLAYLREPDPSDFPAGTCPDGSAENASRTQPCRVGGNGSSGCTVTGSGPSREWTCNLTPGVYYAGWQIGSKTTLNLRPGLYIMAGGGIELENSEGLVAVAGAGGIEPRITIFSTDGPGCPSIPKQCQDGIDIGAQATFKAKATNTASCQAIMAAGGPNTCPWRGMLLWQDGSVNDPTPNNDVKMGGGSNVIIAGTIYAPVSDVSINGGNGTTGCDGSATASCLSVQIISYTWKIDGNAFVEMPYDPNELVKPDLRGLIH